MLKLHFDNTPFVASHGRQPKGRGSWGFCNRPNPDMSKDHVWFSPAMTLVEARKWFKETLKNIGVEGEHTVYILP